MPTPLFVCGGECGIAAVGTLSAGTEHWGTAGVGTQTAVTSGPVTMRSARCLRMQGAGSGASLGHTFATAIASPATLVARFYIYFAALPDVNTLLFADAARVAGVAFKVSDSKIYAGGTVTPAFGATGVAVTTGVWYRIDFKGVRNATITADVSVDGVACAQYSVAGAANTMAGFIVGMTGSSSTADIYYDDIIASGTSGDFPIGDGTVVGLYPNGDRANSATNPTDGNGGHFYSSATDFGKGSAGGTNVGAQEVEATSWTSLQRPLSTTIPTPFISAKFSVAGEHMVWTHDPLPTPAASVNGVMLVATSHSAGTTANTQTMKVTDSAGALGSVLTAWSLLDLSETTITVPVFTMATKPGGGAWDNASVNGSLILWGDSNDTSPVPNLDGVCLEVDYVPGTGPTVPYVNPMPALLAQ